MTVTRVISWYETSGFKLADETCINHIPFEELRSLFNPPVEDPLIYNPYQIDLAQAQVLNRWVDLPFDFDLYYYYVECFQA